MSTELACLPRPQCKDLPRLRVAAIAAEKAFADACESILGHVITRATEDGKRVSAMSRPELITYLREMEGGEEVVSKMSVKYGVTVRRAPCQNRSNFRSVDYTNAMKNVRELHYYADVNWTRMSLVLTFRDDHGHPRSAHVKYMYFNDDGAELTEPTRTLAFRTTSGGSICYTSSPQKGDIPDGPHFFCQVRVESPRGSLGVEKSVDRCSSSDTLYNIRMGEKPVSANRVKADKDVADLKARLAAVENQLKALAAPVEKQ